MSGIIGSKLNHRGSGIVAQLGTDGQHLLSSGAGKSASFETQASADLTPVRQDVLLLALKQATQENSAKFNLANSAIVKFEADADFNLAGSTNVTRNASEYISASSEATGSSMDMTATGTVTRSSAVKKFGTHSADFTANATDNLYYLMSADFEDIPNLAAKRVTTGNFTFEYWYRYASRSGTDRHFSFGVSPQAGANAPILSFAYNTTTSTTTYYPDSTNVYVTYPTLDTTTFHHHAYQRDGTTCYQWIDGIYKNSFSLAESIMPDNHSFILGCRHDNPTETFEGYIDDVRFSNVKRYTNSVNFTPHTSAHTVDENTVFLMNFDSDFNDIGSSTTITVSATGTALGTTNVPTSAVTDVSGVILLKNEEGTATLGTDIKAYFTCDNSNFTEATSYDDAGTFSTGIKMIKLGKTTCTSGSDVRWKLVWANQSDGSKESHIYGIGLNY